MLQEVISCSKTLKKNIPLLVYCHIRVFFCNISKIFINTVLNMCSYIFIQDTFQTHEQ